jgi:hypothetical protein
MTAHTQWAALAGLLLAAGGIYSLQRLFDSAFKASGIIPEDTETCPADRPEIPTREKENP